MLNFCYCQTRRERIKKKRGQRGKITFNHHFSSILQKKLPPEHALSVFFTFP